MLAVTASQGIISVVEKDIPSGPGELIKVTSSGICGSDLHMIEAGLSGVVLGHEFGGTTTDGRLVAIRPTGECGTCSSCTTGRSQTCSAAGRALHGMSRDGGLAEFVIADPNQLFDIPAGVDPSAVALVEPLAVVMHGINRTNIASGSRAVVIGAGSIGLLTAASLVDRGVDVDIVTRHPHQALAAEAIGARTVTQPGQDYDVSFDAVCSQQSFDACVAATRPCGTLLEFGMFWSPVTLNNLLMMKEITVVPSIFYGHTHEHHDFLEAIDLLARTPLLIEALVSHRFALADAAEAFRVANDRKSGAIKVHLLTDL
jgi:threonine dehydrogenase-like Zn-dependent dehydrogenase